MTTYAKTNAQEKIMVDKDSLFTVFMNYEKCKVTARGLKVDTSIYKGIILRKDMQIENYRTVIKEYDSVIVPAYVKKEKTYLEFIKRKEKELRREKKKTFFVGAGWISSIVGILFLL